MSLYYLVLLMSLICAKGSAMKRLENFRVISYRLVSSDYHYSDERMKWRGKYYMPFLYEEYRKGTLQNVGIYKKGFRNWKVILYGKQAYYQVFVTEDGKIVSSERFEYK